MLVIKKGNAKDPQLSGFPGGGALQSQPVKNGTGPSMVAVPVLVAVFSILEKAKDYTKTTSLTMKQGGKKTRENANSLRPRIL